MDLNRLRISERQPATSGSPWKTILLCLVCLGVGFLAGYLPERKNSAVEVTTVVVRPPSASRGARFTAGGWVEVATPKYPVVVSAFFAELIEEIPVSEGETVQAGQVLARFYDKDIRTGLALAKAEHDSARRKAEKMKAGFRAEDIAAAKARVKETTEALKLAETNHKRSAQLLKDGVVTKEVYDEKFTMLMETRARHARVEAVFAKMIAGFRSEDIAVAVAELKSAAEKVKLAERNLKNCTLRAPAGTAWRVLKIHHAVGSRVNLEKSPAVVSLYDPNEMQVRVDVPQSRISSVIPGAPVEVRTEAQSGKIYKGKVIRLEPLAEISKNTITVRSRIDKPDAFLFPEMVAQVTFLGKEEAAPKGLSVPLTAVLTDREASFVFVVENGRAVRRAITKGEQHADLIMVKAGLRSGERVIDKPSFLRGGEMVEEKQ